MNIYLLVRCLHINCVMLWMVGMFALPWCFILHKQFPETLSQTMEKWAHHLLRYFINPALILTVLSGVYLVYFLGGWALFKAHWFQLKLCFLILMFLTHGLLARFRKAFIRNKPLQAESTYITAVWLSMGLMIIINVIVLLN